MPVGPKEQEGETRADGHPPGWRVVAVGGLPVGLILAIDEYLTNLSQELGMIRLDRRPGAGVPHGRRSVELVDELLSEFSDIRNAVRLSAESAYDAGLETFTFEIPMPPEAAPAAHAMIAAMGEVQKLAAEGNILLPPLPEDTAEFFYEFLGECARQAGGMPIGAVPIERAVEEAPPVDVLLEDRRPERLAPAPSLGEELHGATRRFSRDVESAAAARRFVLTTLRGWGLSDAAAEAELPTAELVANALMHSTDEIEVSVRTDGQSVLVEVHDMEGATPELRRRGNQADSGRGLLLVDALVDRWGFDERSVLTKRVWFELPATVPTA